jgi:hypothetical protein
MAPRSQSREEVKTATLYFKNSYKAVFIFQYSFHARRRRNIMKSYRIVLICTIVLFLLGSSYFLYGAQQTPTTVPKDYKQRELLAAAQDYEVVVYEHDNYRGRSLVYSLQPGMCMKLEPELKKAKMNDKITSVKVGKNVEVRMFEHTKYSGHPIILSDSVQSLIPLKFNDKVSSLIVIPKKSHPAGAYLANVNENKRTFYPISETCGGSSYPHLVYNDNATGLSLVTAGCQMKLTLYEHTDFKGKSETFTAGPTDSYFDIGKDLSRKASSLKIDIIGKCPVRTQ